MEGGLLSVVFGHKLAATEDDQVYLFGGKGQNGKQLHARPNNMAPSINHTLP